MYKIYIYIYTSTIYYMYQVPSTKCAVGVAQNVLRGSAMQNDTSVFRIPN